MKLSHESDLLTRDLYYPNSLTRKSVHILTFLCWFILLFAGTTIIGVGTSNNSLTYSYCSDSESFCTQNILVNSSTVLYFYIQLTNYKQNNRMYNHPHSGLWITSASGSSMD